MYAAGSVATHPDITLAITTLTLTYGLSDGAEMSEVGPVGFTNADFASREHRHSCRVMSF